MSTRLYTHGYDFFAPPEAVVYHLWSRDHRPAFTTAAAVPSRLGDEAVKKRLLRLQSQKRVRQLLGMEKPSGEGAVAIESSSSLLRTRPGAVALADGVQSGAHSAPKVAANESDSSAVGSSSESVKSASIIINDPIQPLYGLGKVRSLEEFAESIGVDFATRQVLPGAREGAALLGAGLTDGTAGFVFADSVDDSAEFGTPRINTVKASESDLLALDDATGLGVGGVRGSPSNRSGANGTTATARISSPARAVVSADNDVSSVQCGVEAYAGRASASGRRQEPPLGGEPTSAPSSSALAALKLVKRFMDA